MSVGVGVCVWVCVVRGGVREQAKYLCVCVCVCVCACWRVYTCAGAGGEEGGESGGGGEGDTREGVGGG